MNWDTVEGQWKQRRGKVVHQWGKLMNDDLAAVAGRHEQLVGSLQEKYGIVNEEVKRQVSEIKKMEKQLKISIRTIKKLNKSPRKEAAVQQTNVATGHRGRKKTKQR